MFQRTLVPLDGRHTAEKVLAIAAEEAKTHGGALLVLLRAIPPLRSALMVSVKILVELTKRATEPANRHFQETAMWLKAAGLKVETALVVMSSPRDRSAASVVCGQSIRSYAGREPARRARSPLFRPARWRPTHHQAVRT
jgi:nucleotide-binding universal stress UspA family protein